MEFVLNYLREYPEQFPTLVWGSVAGAGIIMIFVYGIANLIRDMLRSNNKVSETNAVNSGELIEIIKVSIKAIELNSTEMAKSTTSVAKLLENMQNDILVIKDTTTAHRRELLELGLQNRFTELTTRQEKFEQFLAKRQKSFEATFALSQQKLSSNQKKIYESIQALNSQLKNPSQ